MRKPDPLEQSQLGATAGTQATTSLEDQGMGGTQTSATFGSDPYAQMRQRSVPAEQQQTYGGQTVRAAPEQMGPPSPGPQRTTTREGATFENGRMVSMPTTGAWGGQGTSGMPSPAPTMAPGAPSGFAQRRGLEGAAAAMQAPRTAAERIENQPNLFDRMMAAKEGSPERQRLERQFNALPADAQAAQRARWTPFGTEDPDIRRQLRENAQRAFARTRGEMQGGPQGQPQYQPGQIVGSGQYGSVVVGAAGAQMPYVQDPMSPQGEALPVSSGMTRDQYMSNISPGQRQGIRQMIIDAGGKPAEQLLKLEEQRSDLRNLQIVRNRDSSPRSYVGPEEQRLQQQEDDLIWGAMRDPSNLIAGRQRQAVQRQREAEQGQRASQVEQERVLKMEQQRNAKMFEQAYKEAESELADPFQPRNERQIQARAMQKYMQAGGAVPGAQVGAGPGAGMAQPPAMGPAQSGAPDFSQQGVYVDPASPIDFEMTASGGLVAMMPDGEVMAGMNFQGQAVAMPRSAMEVGMLPPGAKYVLPGEVSRGQGKILTKEGETGGLSVAARVAPETEREQIRAGAERVAGERGKAVQSYRKNLDEYNRLMVDARRRAVEMFNQKYGTTTNSQLLKVDAAGNPNFNSTAMRDRFNMDSMKNIDPRGAYEAEIKAAMMESIKASYQDGEVPAWVDRVGTEITGVSEPQPPKGYQRTLYERVLGGDPDAMQKFNTMNKQERELAENGQPERAQEMLRARQERERQIYESQTPQEGQVGPQDIEAARQEYFRARGARPENVMAERLADEASRAWRSSSMRGNKMTVTYRGQELPAVKVRVGGVTATMPRPETAEQVMALLRSQRPFAIEQAGRAMPYKFDPGDPMVQAIFTEQNKVIPANLGAGQANAGATAAIQWANETFGYLPVQVRKSIASALLAEAGYKLTG